MTRSCSRCPPARRWTSTSWCTGTGATPSTCPASVRTSSTGSAVANAAPFEAWLLSQRRRLAAAAESILHEAALGLPRRAATLDRARDLAVRAAVMSPLDENHQALLIRLYRLAGDDEAAERQYAAWAATAERGARRVARAPRSGSRCASGRRAREAVDATRSRRSRRPGRPPCRAGAARRGRRVVRDRGPAGRPRRRRRACGSRPGWCSPRR